MEWGTIIVFAALIIVVAAIVFKLVKDKKQGKSSCGCDCSSCGGCCSSCKGHGGETK